MFEKRLMQFTHECIGKIASISVFECFKLLAVQSKSEKMWQSNELLESSSCGKKFMAALFPSLFY